VSDLEAPREANTWLGLGARPLPVGAAAEWVTSPECGATVLFTGTVRDHAEGRTGVTKLEYEAYEEQVVPKLGQIADHLRERWPVLGRIALLHRVGAVELGEPAVVVAVAAPHRAEAFDAARLAIDTLKQTVPIWKREFWAGGDDWGVDAEAVTAGDRRG
jgi:molybdopterin synthase catalytic subunit